jgi:hypothetical protein
VNETIPPAKDRRWIDENTYVELGEDGRLRLFRLQYKKGILETVLVRVSEKTYARASDWEISEAFPEVREYRGKMYKRRCGKSAPDFS